MELFYVVTEIIFMKRALLKMFGLFSPLIMICTFLKHIFFIKLNIQKRRTEFVPFKILLSK